MGRFTVLLGFSLIGFTVGFFGYLFAPYIVTFLLHVLPLIFRNERIAGAFLSGIVAALLLDAGVLIWTYTSKK